MDTRFKIFYMIGAQPIVPDYESLSVVKNSKIKLLRARRFLYYFGSKITNHDLEVRPCGSELTHYFIYIL